MDTAEVGFDAAAVRRDRRLVVALCLNVALVCGQGIAGFAAQSTGLLADAGHNLTDVAALAAVLITLRLARRAPTARRSFGYHRLTILAAQTNAASVFLVTGLIGYEGVRRLINPEPVNAALVLAVALIALAINGISAFAIRERHPDLSMRSALLHLGSDAAVSGGVALSGLVILITGRFDRLDAIVSLLIGVVIAWQAWKLFRATAEILLESTPSDLDVVELTAVIQSVPGVDEVHDLHTWSLSSSLRALSAHLLIAGHPSLEEAHAVGEEVKRAIARRFAIGHATLELECEGCQDAVFSCDVRQLVPAADPHRH